MFTITDQKKGEDSTVELEISIPHEVVQKHRTHALKHLGEHAEVSGFRKGHIPDNIIIQKFGEQAVLEEAAEHAIEENYPDIVMQAKIQPVSHPKIVITKIAKDNPLELKMTIEVMPQFDLSDYKSIAKKESKLEKVEVTDKEVADIMEEVKKYHSKAKTSSNGDVGSTESEIQSTEGGVEINDEFVKTLGDFKDLTDFKEKMADNLRREKEMQAAQKNRTGILSAIAKKAEIEIPNSFIERELDQMVNEFSHELSRMGQTFESYKTHAKKTEEEIKVEWREKARNRVAHELILQKIAEAENIKADPAAVEKEVAHMLEHYSDTPKERITTFVEDMLSKQEVFKFLESQTR